VDTIRQLVEVLERSDVTRLSWKRGSERLVLQRGSHPAAVAAAVPVQATASSPSAGPRMTPPEPAGPPASEKPGALVTSPFVGTFYRAPGPDQPVFVDVGSLVKKGQVLCIIEAMKLMNEIEAEVAGKVTEILAENGATVEFGQALFRIEPT
ncbi:MAG TPA: acetyl-CoA carboxylase biotin carboxyl carrier protein, partial [Myxococcaceae bacterium]|nr:acetyl-CoA carboxylase biotin carboxyl carrier protein [Myxococcaceae bacterium]